jgi:MFS family permease
VRSSRFLPLFVTQFLGAFNDNVFKNALVIVITFKAATCGESPMLVSVAAGLFILPFLLFSATAGQLADKFDKARLIRLVKMGEVVIMTLGTLALFSENVAALLAVLFLTGAQSSLFGPLKYGILPQHLPHSRLMGANALIQGSTFVAILAGTVLGGLLIAMEPSGTEAVAAVVLGLALAGWWTSRGIPDAPSAQPDLVIDHNPLRQTWRVARMAADNRDVMVAVIGIAWFWFVGAVFLQLLPGFTCDVLGGGASSVTLLLATFTIGIGTGAWCSARLTRGRISLGLVPTGALGMALCAVLPLLLPPPPPSAMEQGIATVLAASGNWPVLLGFLGLALFGGLFVVPQFAFVQAHSPPERRARIIASANVLNALFMVLASVVTVGLLGVGVGVPGVFATTGVLTVLVGMTMYCASPGIRAGLRRRG